jgi:ribulose-phosphate 3-epimerase
MERNMQEVKIAPSILSADFTRLGEDVGQVLQAGAEYIHVDVMDGIFVPNISIGVPVVKSLRKAFPRAFLDVHLMITQPGRYVKAFCDAGADLLMFHVEADSAEAITQAIADTKALGVKVGLSVKPATPAAALEPWLKELDMALVMTVEPGFGGQSFMADQLPKIAQLRQRLEEVNPACELEVDGGIAPDTAPLVIQAGANVLVAGSAVFGKADRAAAIEKLRQ